MDVTQLLRVLALVLLGEGLEALHDDAGVVAIVHVDTRGTHPRLVKNSAVGSVI